MSVIERQDDIRVTKVPYRASFPDQLASTTDKKTWASYSVAEAAYVKGRGDVARGASLDSVAEGLGFVLEPAQGLVGIDLDHCIGADNTVNAFAQDILARADTYVEASPSGTGVHLFLYGSLPRAIKRPEIELYAGGRYLTITGHVIGDARPIRQAQDIVTALVDAHKVSAESEMVQPTTPVALPDMALLALLYTRRPELRDVMMNGASLTGDRSADDFAVCCALMDAPLCADDATVDRVLRASALMRAKWDELHGAQTYGALTIHQARGRVGHPPRDSLRFERSDLGNVALFASLFRETTCAIEETGTLMIWREHFWSPARTTELLTCVRRAIAARLVLASTMSVADGKLERTFAIQSQNRGRVDAVLAYAARELAVPIDQWNVDKSIVGAPNGIIDLRTGALRAGRRDDYVSMSVGVAFDPDATCPNFERFLQSTFVPTHVLPDDWSAPPPEYLEKLNAIKRYLGYCLTGYRHERVFFALVGPTAAGKSTFLNLIFSVLGHYAVTTAAENLAAGRMQMRDKFASSAWIGKRLLTASETMQGAALDVSLVKTLASDDPIPARPMRATEFFYDGHMKLWVIWNEKPLVKDRGAIWRRLKLIDTPNSYPTENHQLLTQLATERAGILALMVREAMAYLAEGLLPSTVIDEAGQDFQEDEDPLRDFLTSDCLMGDDAADAEPLLALTLYQGYQTWCHQQGIEAQTQTWFGLKMRDRPGLRKKRDTGGVWYRGITLTGEAEARRTIFVSQKERRDQGRKW